MVLVIDAQIAGISGDMMLSALVDLGASTKKITDGIRAADELFDGSRLEEIDFTKTKKHGLEATSLKCTIHDDIQERKGITIRQCISDACQKIGLSSTATDFACNSIQTLIDAESKIHGEPADSVCFHEAASFDTVIDILGVAIALDDLKLFAEDIVCTPVAVGSGTVTFSHGTTSNPASAILEIFSGSNITLKGTKTDSELTTPTGACMLYHLASRCSDSFPPMTIQKIGYGAGQKDFDAFSNVLKLVWGKSSPNHTVDTIQILETNIDDVSGEVMGHLIERLTQNGAKDVTVTSGITKKNRPTSIVTVLCDVQDANTITQLLISETGTLGVRTRTSERIIVHRKTQTVSIKIDGQEFSVTYKINQDSGQFKVESDDVQLIARSISKPFRETEALIRNKIEQM